MAGCVDGLGWTYGEVRVVVIPINKGVWLAGFVRGSGQERFEISR